MKIKSMLSLCISIAIFAIAAIQLHKEAKADAAEETVDVHIIITNGSGLGTFSGIAVNQSEPKSRFQLKEIPKTKPPVLGGTITWPGGDQDFDVYVCSDLGYGGHMVMHLFPQGLQEFSMTVSQGCPQYNK